MNQLIYLLILFCILYLIETKAINILLSFVAIIISLAFILPTITKNIINIESEYYSYILILVQVSALTILFGFIIMLYPNLSHSNSQFKTSKQKIKNNKNIFFYIIPLLIIGSILYIVIIKEYMIYFYYFLQSLFLQSPLLIDSLNISELSLKDNSSTIFLYKLGIYLYSIDHNIIKLFILTIILLLAIIALFFLII